MKRYLVFFTRPVIDATELTFEKGKIKAERSQKYYSYVDAESFAMVKNHCTRQDTINHIFVCPDDKKFIEVMTQQQFRIKCIKAKIAPSIQNWNAYMDLSWDATMVELGTSIDRIPLTLLGLTNEKQGGRIN